MASASYRLRLTVAAMFLVGTTASAQYWKHTDISLPAGTPNGYGIATGPDGNLWIAAGGTGILRLTPAGVFTPFAIPGGLGAYAITAGPDGNLWFQAYNDTVGRITPGGTITLFPIGTFISQGDMTPGPDGNVWFTKFCDDALYRVTPAGAVTRFPVPTSGACATGLAAGSDGNLWFSEHYRNKIGRMTPTGDVTEFPIGPVDYDYPNEITAGSDGNLWFTSNYGVLRRITTDGTITTQGSGSLHGVISGGGYLWFTSSVPVLIAKFSVISGDLESFFLPDTDHAPVAMAFGPDGALWFPERYTMGVGRLGAPATGLFTLTPCRLADTRLAEGPSLTAGSRVFVAAGRCGIPSTAVSIVLNVTVVRPDDVGYLALAPTGAAKPGTSTLNYRQGQTRANNAVVQLGADGNLVVFCEQTTGKTDLVLDVSGYFQ